VFVCAVCVFVCVCCVCVCVCCVFVLCVCCFVCVLCVLCVCCVCSVCFLCVLCVCVPFYLPRKPIFKKLCVNITPLRSLNLIRRAVRQKKLYVLYKAACQEFFQSSVKHIGWKCDFMVSSGHQDRISGYRQPLQSITTWK